MAGDCLARCVAGTGVDRGRHQSPPCRPARRTPHRNGCRDRCCRRNPRDSLRNCSGDRRASVSLTTEVRTPRIQYADAGDRPRWPPRPGHAPTPARWPRRRRDRAAQGEPEDDEVRQAGGVGDTELCPTRTCHRCRRSHVRVALITTAARYVIASWSCFSGVTVRIPPEPRYSRLPLDPSARSVSTESGHGRARPPPPKADPHRRRRRSHRYHRQHQHQKARGSAPGPRRRRRRSGGGVAAVAFPYCLPGTEVLAWQVLPGGAGSVSVDDSFDDSTVVLRTIRRLSSGGRALSPGWAAPDLDGAGGRPVSEGATSLKHVMDLPAEAGTGGFCHDSQTLSWWRRRDCFERGRRCASDKRDLPRLSEQRSNRCQHEHEQHARD